MGSKPMTRPLDAPSDGLKRREESFRQTLITLWHSSRNVSKPLTSPVDNFNGRLISLNNPGN
jgi:hypothetical protein